MSTTSNANDARNRMLQICEEAIQLFQSIPAPTVEQMNMQDENPSDVIQLIGTAFAWTNRAMRSALLAMLGNKQGFAAETTPLIRAAVEHGVCVHWISKYKFDALRALRGEQIHAAGKIKRAQEKGWSFADDQVQEILELLSVDDRDQMDRMFDTQIHFVIRSQLGEKSTEYQAWLIATQTSHATLASANMYYMFDENGHVDLYHSPKNLKIEVKAQASLACVSALEGYARFVQDERIIQKCIEFGTELNSLAALLN
jgi:hypothetical protein